MEELDFAEERAYYALTRKAFDFLAPVYDLLTWPLARVRQQAVNFANPPQGAFVLDVATGTGQQASAFAQQGCQVVGVDLTESMLAVARKHNRDGLVRFEVGDATHLCYAANTFDITCVSFALHDMPPMIREKVLREMVRITKRDGTLMIIDYGLPHNKVFRAVLYRLISLYESGYYRQFIASDLRGSLEAVGIRGTGEFRALLGAARVLRGRKT